MNKSIVTIALLIALCLYVFPCYSQEQIIGMSKISVQSILKRQLTDKEVTPTKIEISSTGQECWFWTEIKREVRYMAVYNSKGHVEQCLLIPLNTKSFEKHKKIFNLFLKSELNGKAWITPVNSNGIKCLITTIELRKDPL